MDWRSEENTLFSQLILDQMTTGCYWIIIMAMVLFPAFSLTDVFNNPQAVKELLILRFLTTAFFISIFLFRKRISLFKTKPFTGAILLLSICAISVTIMCNYSGGFKSEYYAGINLCVLAALVLPLEAKSMFKIFVVLTSIYLVGVGLFNTPSDQIGSILNNLSFFISTGVISVIAAHLSDTLRKESFQSQRSLNLKDEFIVLASHELNTPLTSLNLQTQMAAKKLKENKHSTESMEKLVTLYNSQLSRIIKTVDDMFHISQIQSGKLKLEHSQANLGMLVQNVVDSSGQKILTEELTIDIEIQNEIIGKWDTFRIEQVLLNLITNAVKFSDGKPIKIIVAQKEGWAIIDIIDQGIGISPDNQKRVFEKYERAVSRNDYSGLGLGLYISSQIARAHGGQITVDSKLGEGSKFSLHLPISQ